MAAIVEREVKLAHRSAAEARAALRAAGATMRRPRRLQQDELLDNAERRLQQRRSVLRVRRENGETLLTLKGPVDVSERRFKQREELETVVADGAALRRILDELGFVAWFRYEKYREEYSWKDVVAAVDETPIGTFVELEGDEAGIVQLAAALGFRPEEFIIDSYRALYLRYCAEHAMAEGDMVFARE
jgi:adenylate cyclase class 2